MAQDDAQRCVGHEVGSSVTSVAYIEGVSGQIYPGIWENVGSAIRRACPQFCGAPALRPMPRTNLLSCGDRKLPRDHLDRQQWWHEGMPEVALVRSPRATVG